ncbi:MAG: GDP-mannose 4,6-dehydratase [Planctomycetota bacterium]
MSILVTGGAGFIGSHLVERLLAATEERVICLDAFDAFLYPAGIKRRNVAHFASHPRVTVCEGDIRDRAFVTGVFRREDVRRVVHLAALAGVRPSLQDPRRYFDVNAAATLTLLELAREHRVERFVFGSSSSVYGESRRVPFAEDDPIEAPISPYAASKRTAELFVLNYHALYGIPVAVLRFFTVFGPRQRPEMAIADFVRRVDTNQEIPFFGNGASRRDYTFVTDIVDGIVAALFATFPAAVLNLGGSRTTSLSDLVALIGKVLGKTARLKRLPDQPGDVPVTWADISRAKTLLGYEPRVPVETGIREYVNWYHGNTEHGNTGK